MKFTIRTPCLINNDDDNFSSAEMEVASSKKRSKKRIRFFEAVSVRPSLHLYDMTEEEIDNTWYTEEETEIIRKNLINDLNRMMMLSGESSGEEDPTSSFRGLEYHTKDGRNKRRDNKW
eukprot:CAMPEP_0194158994 /NCGR_PEP_ID=MMETSP0152-20130528/77584_1 /TAXON_ID=1049557 /ORGANISM="Thalassiothrix antarctica, Strain L6-D1" /LENGTH=118 /DNA_ID=CAMNT_0038868511 /DNA_START=70 /DNA_END=423 /DNA_ORIENTATION=-